MPERHVHLTADELDGLERGVPVTREDGRLDLTIYPPRDDD